MNWLQMLRRTRGLTQQELGKLIGVDAPMISKMERGWLAKAPGEMGPKLEALFGMSFAELMRPFRLEMKTDFHQDGSAPRPDQTFGGK